MAGIGNNDFSFVWADNSSAYSGGDLLDSNLTGNNDIAIVLDPFGAGGDNVVSGIHNLDTGNFDSSKSTAPTHCVYFTKHAVRQQFVWDWFEPSRNRASFVRLSVFTVLGWPALPKLAGVTAIARGAAGPLTAAVVIALFVGFENKTAPTAMAAPPYQNCNEARADGRSSIPSTDPAYRPELDFDGDGLACEPGKSRRSTR